MSSERPNELPIATSPRRYGLGLRAQMLLVLTASFALTFGALSIVVVSAAQHAQTLEHAQRARALAEALATSLADVAPPMRTRTLASLVGRGELRGLALSAPHGVPIRVGDASGPPSAERILDDDERLTIWLRAPTSEQASPLGRLLRLYALVTGSVILLVVYVALTRLIVRPVEQLTHAVERLPTRASPGEPARGTSLEHTERIPLAGAAELSRLAVSFNAMTRELGRERSALEARFAELERTTRELRATQDQLIRSEKLASVGRLAAGVAHEIGNPLAAILGLVELIQAGGLAYDDERELLVRIRSETERIHHIIRDLLDYARASPAPDDAHADLAQVVDEAVQLIAPQKDLRRVTIERRLLGNDLAVRASSHALTQVVLNLLLNAADAVAGEGRIVIELARESAEVRLTIADTGPGIPSVLYDKLFDPFFTTKPAGKGTGLGLAVCHAIVERAGGSIVAERPEAGARFTVRLPAFDV